MEWIAIIMAGICLYQVHEIKKLNVSEEKQNKKINAEEVSKKKFDNGCRNYKGFLVRL